MNCEVGQVVSNLYLCRRTTLSSYYLLNSVTLNPHVFVSVTCIRRNFPLFFSLKGVRQESFIYLNHLL